MSRTYRTKPTHLFRSPKTYNELKQSYFDSDDYGVSYHKRYIPTSYDDIHISAYKQLDHPPNDPYRHPRPSYASLRKAGTHHS